MTMWKPRKALHDAKQTFLRFIFLTVEKNQVTQGKRHMYDIYAYKLKSLDIKWKAQSMSLHDGWLPGFTFKINRRLKQAGFD